MSLSIMVRLRSGSYDAGGERPSDGEWPPHPARVFCALVASVEDESGWSALRWLEEQAPPEVWADAMSRIDKGRTRSYVVQNAVEKGGGNLTWPGRTNGLRQRSFVVPSCDSFAFVWPQVDPSSVVLNQLALLAWKVPYFGRSTSSAQLGVMAGLPQMMSADATIYEPADYLGDNRSWDVRVPYPGYCDALRTAYAAGLRSWEVARTRPYRRAERSAAVESATMTAVTQGPFRDLMVWAIDRPAIRIGGEKVIELTRSLRRVVISRVPDPVPGQISGHTEPGRPHVAFLAIPDVGHRHADGHVLGLALAVPRDLPREHLASLLRALITEPSLSRIALSHGRDLAVHYGADGSGLTSTRWTADEDGAHDWVTVTPVMLDGHTRRGRDEASEVARSLAIAGYPKPAEVEVSASPMVAGGIWRPRAGTLPPSRPQRQLVHAWVRFSEPVRGPVLAGSMRYLGLGLFMPTSRRQAGIQTGTQTSAAVAQ
jgi:CRISPR-associated protein Csb2